MFAAGLNKDLVPLLFRKTDNFIFNTGAITGADSLNLSAVERRAVEIVQDYLFRLLIGVSNIADRRIIRLEAIVVGKTYQLFVAVLNFQVIGINAAQIDAGRRTGFKAACRNTEPFQ